MPMKRLCLRPWLAIDSEGESTLIMAPTNLPDDPHFSPIERVTKAKSDCIAGERLTSCRRRVYFRCVCVCVFLFLVWQYLPVVYFRSVFVY